MVNRALRLASASPSTPLRAAPSVTVSALRCAQCDRAAFKDSRFEIQDSGFNQF